MTDDEVEQVLLDQRQELSVPPHGGRWVPRRVERTLRDALSPEVAKVIYTVDNGLTTALSTKVTGDRALLENLVFQELRRRGVDLFTWSEPDAEVDFLTRDGRRVAGLVQVCAALDTSETVSREYRALHKASAATRCRDLVILTRDGTPPPASLVPKGPAVAVRPAWEWLLAAP